jgi:pimeloyl-ACP methyl ester carboxylesterase
MPDLRGHGDSAKPHDAAAYPPDVLADDGFALVEQLGLTDYDLGGYSLGARTTVRMLARGASPGRAILAGMGLEGIIHTAGRGAHFRRILTNLGTFKPGSVEWMAEAFLKTVGGDPVALLHILDTFVDTPREALARIGMPTLVLMGAEDDDNGSAEALSAALPDGRYAVVPGNHMSAVTKPELGVAIAEFLDGGTKS